MRFAANWEQVHFSETHYLLSDIYKHEAFTKPSIILPVTQTYWPSWVLTGPLFQTGLGHGHHENQKVQLQITGFEDTEIRCTAGKLVSARLRKLCLLEWLSLAIWLGDSLGRFSLFPIPSCFRDCKPQPASDGGMTCQWNIRELPKESDAAWSWLLNSAYNQ